MSVKQIQRFSTEIIEAKFTDDNGMPLTGVTPVVSIRRHSDGLFWSDFGTLVTAATTHEMTAASSEAPGFYQFTFDTTGLVPAVYTIEAEVSGTSSLPQVGELVVGGYVDNLDSSIQGVSNLAVGQKVVNVHGTFSEAEKKRLFNTINDRYEELENLISNLTITVADIASEVKRNKLATESKFKIMSNKLLEVSESVNAQSEFLLASDEENSLEDDINV